MDMVARYHLTEGMIMLRENNPNKEKTELLVRAVSFDYMSYK